MSTINKKVYNPRAKRISFSDEKQKKAVKRVKIRSDEKLREKIVHISKSKAFKELDISPIIKIEELYNHPCNEVVIDVIVDEDGAEIPITYGSVKSHMIEIANSWFNKIFRCQWDSDHKDNGFVEKKKWIPLNESTADLCPLQNSSEKSTSHSESPESPNPDKAGDATLSLLDGNLYINKDEGTEPTPEKQGSFNSELQSSIINRKLKFSTKSKKEVENFDAMLALDDTFEDHLFKPKSIKPRVDEDSKKQSKHLKKEPPLKKQKFRVKKFKSATGV